MTSLKYIIFPIITAILSQTIKVIIETIKSKKLDIVRFFDGMAGIPSTHSALVTSITTLIYLDYGVTSPLFSITLIFSLIVIYDSMGIRYESGNQARILNKAFGTNLKERLGHRPIETLVGVIFGITTTLLLVEII
ncbi:MAG: divergent PAP2 family protein [Bacilli bacterium]